MNSIYKGEAKSAEENLNYMDVAGPGMSIVRACSEALFFGVASCFSSETAMHHAIRDSLHPCSGQQFATCSKLMINVLSSGKASGSTVKFSRFYLIVDGFANPETNIPLAYSKFIAALKKSFSSVKSGEAAFKVGPEGSFFNAFSTIVETFKQFEEAIAQSGANGVTSRPSSNS
jgi:hypothetical protein